MAKKLISKTEAKKLAKKAGADFSKSPFEQRPGVMDKISALSKVAGYRKPKTAKASTGAYFFNHLKKY